MKKEKSKNLEEKYENALNDLINDNLMEMCKDVTPMFTQQHKIENGVKCKSIGCFEITNDFLNDKLKNINGKR